MSGIRVKGIQWDPARTNGRPPTKRERDLIKEYNTIARKVAHKESLGRVVAQSDLDRQQKIQVLLGSINANLLGAITIEGNI